METQGIEMSGTNSLLEGLKARRAAALGADAPEKQDMTKLPVVGVPVAPAALGINPPEKDLPPPAVPPVTPVTPAASPAAKRGRPKKDPLGADAMAAVTPAPAAPVESKQLILPFDVEAPNRAVVIPGPSMPSAKDIAVEILDELVRRLGQK